MLNKIIRNLRKLKYKYIDSEYDLSYPCVYWHNPNINLGDVLNYDLVKRIAGLEHVNWVPYNFNKEYFLVVGSILHRANKNAVVWGSGLISPDILPLFKPKKILAVRGPLTRNILIKSGIDCPEVYGDPALLLPKYYNPGQSNKKYKIGIIPHLVDKNHAIFKRLDNPHVKIIDIETDDVEGFINQLVSCEKILSSSLHGLIISDAYGVPSRRIVLSKNIIGGDFKFNDYDLSVNRTIQEGVIIREDTKEKDLLSIECSVAKNIDLTKLIESCPF